MGFEKVCRRCGVKCSLSGSGGYQHPPPDPGVDACQAASLHLTLADVVNEILSVEEKLSVLRDHVEELPGELLYYGLKDIDSELTPEDVRALQKEGHLTVELLLVWFAKALRKDWPTPASS